MVEGSRSQNGQVASNDKNNFSYRSYNWQCLFVLLCVSGCSVRTVRLEKIAATELLEHALSDDFFEISNKIAYDRALTFFSVVS